MSSQSLRSSRPGTGSHRISESLSEPDSRSRPLRLYYAPQFKSVAQEVARLGGGSIELCDIQWDRFPDGWPNLLISKANEMKASSSRSSSASSCTAVPASLLLLSCSASVCCLWLQWFRVAFLASFHSPAVFFEQIAVATYLPKLLPRSYALIVPFFPTGTMERVTRPGEIATAATMARLLSTVPSCAGGPAQISVFDIHTLQSQFYFVDSVLIRLSSAIPLLLQRLRDLPDCATGRLNVAFPDDGALKRFGDQFASLFPHPVVCQKVREGERRQVKIKEGEVQARHVVIVDDLVQSGGTLIECARQLRREGAAAVSAYVTHAVFPNEAERRFMRKGRRTSEERAREGQKEAERQGEEEDEAVLDTFWLTDSNPVVADRVRALGRPFEVLSLAPLLVDILLDDTA